MNPMNPTSRSEGNQSGSYGPNSQKTNLQERTYDRASQALKPKSTASTSKGDRNTASINPGSKLGKLVNKIKQFISGLSSAISKLYTKNTGYALAPVNPGYALAPAKQQSAPAPAKRQYAPAPAKSDYEATPTPNDLGSQLYKKYKELDQQLKENPNNPESIEEEKNKTKNLILGLIKNNLEQFDSTKIIRKEALIPKDNLNLIGRIGGDNLLPIGKRIIRKDALLAAFFGKEGQIFTEPVETPKTRTNYQPMPATGDQVHAPHSTPGYGQIPGRLGSQGQGGTHYVDMKKDRDNRMSQPGSNYGNPEQANPYQQLHLNESENSSPDINNLKDPQNPKDNSVGMTDSVFAYNPIPNNQSSGGHGQISGGPNDKSKYDDIPGDWESEEN